MDLFVHDGPEALASHVAAGISSQINEKIGTFSWALAGASTPQPTYQLLRHTTTPWERVTAWLGDERWVPPDSEQSNGRMAAEILFDHVPATLLRPEWRPDLDPEESAASYGQRLRELEREAGQHDLIILGLGDDGHTASLFPGSDALAETEDIYIATRMPETGEVRLTATYPLLNSARRVVFLVVGESKAEALKSSLEGETPACRVGDGNGVVEWHVDRQAASLLS